MSHHPTRARLGAAVAILAAALLAAPAAATAAPSQNGLENGIERHVPAHAASAAEYWTPERMRSAIPAEVLVADDARRAKDRPVKQVEAGAPMEVRAQKPKPNATQVSPISYVGKVFFTLNGSNYVCSGNAVSSANELTVSTAGHCVNEGGGAYASRWIFVPAYNNGAAPYGQWTATELVTTSAWAQRGDISYDGAFAVMAPLNGRTLSDTVGATGIAFNLARGLSYTAYGYPAASPFNGQTLQRCAGTAKPDPYGQSQSQGIPCDMTGGSSGGPWFTSSGVQNSVNSFGYTAVRNTMFGPYFGSAIQQAYQSAAN